MGVCNVKAKLVALDKSRAEMSEQQMDELLDELLLEANEIILSRPLLSFVFWRRQWPCPSAVPEKFLPN